MVLVGFSNKSTIGFLFRYNHKTTVIKIMSGVIVVLTKQL